ncbi:MAG: nuclear transport factor 2 family protein [Deltaproteobacteria bacterium]|nr:nuclear transport factor 2 family protein [Deltaproteobacteria bacterium]
MKPLELAYQYMDYFYGEGPIDAMKDLLTEPFTFKGPFYEFDGAEAYIASLKADPPKDMDYDIMQAYENETSACLVYQFSKEGVSTAMSQTFEVTNGKISRILLVFDSGAFG